MTHSQAPLNPYAPTQTIPDDSFDPMSAFAFPQAMARVATGLRLVYWSIALIVLSVVGGRFVLPLMMRGSSMGTMNWISFAMGLVMMLGIVLGLIGRVFCLAIPQASRARGLINAAVAFDLAAILIWTISWVVAVPFWSQSLGNLLSLTATALFVLFLKRLSAHLQRPDLEGNAKSLMVMVAVLFVVGIAAAVAGYFVGIIAGLFGVVLLVIMVLLLLRYIRLLSNLRKAILGRLGTL
ncbi:hypothetical protein Enr13x_59490 [Stieleria neptunia]|uniref:Uncharacterized protein n=1 Tax=Stieleria neptunia TaxID=2527979 RepID=A0A518HYW4_9BACT|nr:hypothetical protein [Stieleria neptunia]QDV46045.1 hypothetical protein Enr13x_59490 [Stieleria neptunia]